MLSRILALALLVTAISCGKKKDDDDAAPTATLSGASAVSAMAATTVSNMAVFSAASSFTNFLNADWTTAGGNWNNKDIAQGEDGCDGTNDDPASYMDNVLNSNCPNSNFWDLMGLFKLSCAVFATVPTTSGLPDVGSDQAITISAATKSLCGLPDDISDFEPIVVDVTATTTQTVYQRKISLSVAGNDGAYVFWYGTDGSKANMQFQDAGLLSPNPPGANFVGFYSVDSDVTLFELQGRYDTTNDVAFFVRLHVDGDKATALGTMGNAGTASTNYVNWSYQGFSGDPSDADPANPISVNLAWNNGGGAADDLSTCVNPSTKAATGTVITCGTYQAPAAVGTINTFVGGIADTLIGLTNTALLGIADETTTPSFTAATIHSAARIQ